MRKILLLVPGIFKIGGIQKFTDCFLSALVNEFPDAQILVFSLNDNKIGETKLGTNVKFNLSFKIGSSITNDNFVEYNEMCRILNDSGARFQIINYFMYANITDFDKLIKNIKILLKLN